MEKIIVTEYGKVVSIDKVEQIIRKTIPLDDEGAIPYALFALLDSGEMVNIGNFYDIDVAEIIELILDVFAGDENYVFDVNLEKNGIVECLKLLKYISEGYYPSAVRDLKRLIASGEIDVSFT